MLRYIVKKCETQSDCHLLDVWINRIKRLVTVKKAITHKTNLENIYIFSQTPGGKSYDAAYVVAVALDRMIKHGANVKETSLDSILTAKTPAMFGNKGEHLWNTLKMYVEKNKKIKCNIKLFNKLHLSFLFFFLFFLSPLFYPGIHGWYNVTAFV